MGFLQAFNDLIGRRNPEADKWPLLGPDKAGEDGRMWVGEDLSTFVHIGYGHSKPHNAREFGNTWYSSQPSGYGGFSHAIHRDGAPAVIWDGGREHRWYQHGLRHREDGPAVTRANGSKEWWYQGQEITWNGYDPYAATTAATLQKFQEAIKALKFDAQGDPIVKVAEDKPAIKNQKPSQP